MDAEIGTGMNFSADQHNWEEPHVLKRQINLVSGNLILPAHLAFCILFG
jgi:hypothetical protein